MQSVRMELIAEKEKGTQETAQQVSSDPVTPQTSINWQDVVVAEEASTLTKDQIDVRIVGLAIFAMVTPPSQTQLTQEEMEERSVQRDTTAHGDHTQPSLAQLVTSIQMKVLD